MFPLLYIFTVARYLMVNKVVYNVYWVSLCVYTGITEQARTLPSIKKHQTYEDPHTSPRTFCCPRKDDLTSIAIRAHRTRPCCVLRTAFVGVCVCVCIGVARNLCLGGWQPRHPRCGDRDAEGVEEGRVWGAGVPSPADYGVWGSVVPQRGKRVLGVFGAWKNTPDSHKCVIFEISAAYI